MSKLSVGMAAAAMAAFGMGDFSEPAKATEPELPRQRSPSWGSHRSGFGYGATPMIKGGKLAKRLKRGKLLFRP
jgi:hypothetical protein